MIFNFSHTDIELREVIHALELKIQTLQTLLQKMVNETNAQAFRLPAANEAAQLGNRADGGQRIR